MAKTNYQTIDQYHEAFNGETIARMEIIRKIINNSVPGVTECISYQIACFKYEGYLIYYAAFPNHISLAHPWTANFLEHFKKDLEEYKISKSVIQIPNDKPLPEKLIEKIVLFRMKENEAKAKK